MTGRPWGHPRHSQSQHVDVVRATEAEVRRALMSGALKTASLPYHHPAHAPGVCAGCDQQDAIDRARALRSAS